MINENIKRSDAVEAVRLFFARVLRDLPTIDTEIGEAYDPDAVDALMDKYKALQRRICDIPPAAPYSKAYEWIQHVRTCASAKTGCTEVTTVLVCPNCGMEYSPEDVRDHEIRYCYRCGIKVKSGGIRR